MERIDAVWVLYRCVSGDAFVRTGGTVSPEDNRAGSLIHAYPAVVRGSVLAVWLELGL